MATRITIAKIEGVRIPTGKVEVKLWDNAVSGLVLRCFAAGSFTWGYRYREGGGGRSAKIRMLKLGSYPAVTIDAARVAAKAYAGLIAQGVDPVAVRQEKRRRERSTLGILLEAYERSLAARGIVKQKVIMAVLRRGLSKYMNTDVAKLTRQDLVATIHELEDLPGAQAELRKHTRGLLEWTTNSGLTPHNVLAGLRLPLRTRQQRLEQAAKRRALDDDAIVAVWRAADRHRQFGGLVQLGLLTAMRRSELAHLRWSDIGADRITVTAERTKTGSAHEVPLTGLMRSILERQTRTTSPLLFPSGRNGKAIAEWSVPKAKLMRDANAGEWTLHDLRRTCRTLMERLGVAEPVAEAAIGHVRRGLIGLYALDPKWEARVDAFARVSRHVEALLG